MGTSTSASGAGSGSPLVPSWLDEPVPGTGDGNSPGEQSPAITPPTQPMPMTPPNQPVINPTAPRPRIIPPPQPNRFRQARAGFSRFASSGGRDTSSMRQSIGNYVSIGTGGSRRASRRMGSSRAVGSQFLGVLRDINTVGVPETLRRLNLTQLVGQPIDNIFLGIAEAVCPPGGDVDQAIARNAMLETMIDFTTQVQSQDLGDLTPDQLTALFRDYITNTIRFRILNDIGTRSVRLPDNHSDAIRIQRQLNDYIRGAVSDTFPENLSSISGFSDQQLQTRVDAVYEESFEVLRILGEQE